MTSITCLAHKLRRARPSADRQTPKTISEKPKKKERAKEKTDEQPKKCCQPSWLMPFPRTPPTAVVRSSICNIYVSSLSIQPLLIAGNSVMRSSAYVRAGHPKTHVKESPSGLVISKIDVAFKLVQVHPQSRYIRGDLGADHGRRRQ